MQFHMESIHSPHSTRNMIMNECRKSWKFHPGMFSFPKKESYCGPNSCIPITAKMKMMIARTKQRLPRAPIVRPIIPINKFNVGHDLASLKTRNYETQKTHSNVSYVTSI